MKNKILALTLLGVTIASAQFLGPPTAYPRVTADTLSDTALTLFQVPSYGGSNSVKMRSMTKAELQAAIIASGGNANFDTLSCQTCYFADTINNIRDTVNTMLNDGVAIVNVTDYLRVVGPGGIGSAFRADTGSAGITIGADVTIQNDADIIGADSVNAEKIVSNGLLAGDTSVTRALRATSRGQVGSVATDLTFNFGVGGSGGAVYSAITNTSTSGYTALVLNQAATGGSTPAYLLRYNSAYGTTALRNKMDVAATGGLRLVTGASLNKVVNIDTNGRVNADSLYVTGHSTLENVDITDLTIGSTYFDAFETNLAGDTITQSCGGPGACAIRISGSSHDVNMDYPVSANDGLTTTTLNARVIAGNSAAGGSTTFSTDTLTNIAASTGPIQVNMNGGYEGQIVNIYANESNGVNISNDTTTVCFVPPTGCVGTGGATDLGSSVGYYSASFFFHDGTWYMFGGTPIPAP